MNRRQLILAVTITFAIVLAVGPTAADWAGPSGLTDAVARARALDRYEFTADMEQTLIPRPSPGMIGASDQRVDVRLEGSVDGEDYAELTALFEGGGLNLPALEIVQDGSETFVIENGERRPIQNPVGVVAVSGDYLGYLEAADNIRLVKGGAATESADASARFERYTFDIEGAKLAKRVRDAAQAQMQREGTADGRRLPPGFVVSASPVLERMTGTGELWVDASGLPARQILDLNIPGASDAFNATAHVVMDYRFEVVDDDTMATAGLWFSQGLRGITATIGGAAATTNVPEILGAAILLTACAYLCLGRRRWAYVVIAGSVTVIMLTTPVLQAASMLSFLSGTRTAEAATRDTLNEALGLEAESLDDAGAETPVEDKVQYEPEGGTSGPKCGDGEAGVDTDEDGLNDRDEYCLGTDPNNADSDQDLIEDAVELEGFEIDGQSWPADPINPDANRDGLPDYAEWPQPEGQAPEFDDRDDWDPDADGVPNLWDADNDGDGVTDGLDLSPYSFSEYTDEFTLVIDEGGYGGYAFVELQIQPENEDHLRYSTSPLDWPYDNLGQLQDLDDSPDDLRLTPMLWIRTDSPPDRETARASGVSVFWDGENETYNVYASLAPVGDGGQIVSYAAQVVYGPDELEDVRWDSAKVVWASHLEMDQMDALDRITTRTVPLHTYPEDSIRLAGLRISARDDYEIGIVGTPGSPDDDRQLFNVLLGMSATYLTNQTPTLQTLEGRFSGLHTDPVETWGVPSTDIAMDLPTNPYGHLEEGMADVMTRVSTFLGDNGYPTGSQPSLILATQEKSGVYSLDSEEEFVAGVSFAVNLDNVAMATSRGLKLATYTHSGGTWGALDARETADLVVDRYEGQLAGSLTALADYPDLTGDDLIRVMVAYYMTWFVGQTRIIQLDGRETAPSSRGDQVVYDQIYVDAADLPEYLIESLELGEPTAGLRVGFNTSSMYEYRADLPWLADTSGFGYHISTFLSIDDDVISAHDVGMIASTAITTVKMIFKIRSAVKLAQNFSNVMKIDKAFSVFQASSTIGRALSVLGFVVSVAMIWLSYGLGTDWDDPVQAKQSIIQGVVATLITTALFLISLTLLGAFFALAFALLDALAFLISWGQFSITASIIRWVYHVEYLTFLADADFLDVRTEMVEPDVGLIAGYKFRVDAEYRGELDHTPDGSADDVDDSRSYTLGRYIGTMTTDAQAINQHTSRQCGWERNRWGTEVYACRNDVAVEYTLDEPGRNLKLKVKPTITASIYYKECSFGDCDRKRDWVHLPNPDGHPYWTASTMYMDVLPTSVSGLWEWADIDNPDFDSDGLTAEQETALGLDAQLWDTDGDGLSDGYEVESGETRGTDPLDADVDDDGLSDGFELLIGTRIDQADTDDDGVSDADAIYHQDILDADNDGDTDEWMGGWSVTLPERDPAWVFAHPLAADGDDDGLEDGTERENATSPHAVNAGPRISLDVSPTTVDPNGRVAVYVAPGDSLDMDLVMENAGVDPVDEILSLCLPDFLENVDGGTMTGDSTPATGGPDAGVCSNGLGWSFADPDELASFEAVETSVSADVSSISASDSQDIVAHLPYPILEAGDEVRTVASVVVDAEDPTATFADPLDGAVIGGGISTYVLGGAADDATSWIDRVELALGGDNVTATGTDPWSHTWSLPSDGVYQLTATSYDFVGHASTADEVEVTVDNTDPTATLDFADGSFVTASDIDPDEDTILIELTGDAADNLSGVKRVQVSTDSRPWREVWTSATNGVVETNWSTEWVLPNDVSSQGKHTVAMRAIDVAGNVSAVERRELTVDIVPPTDELSDRSYLDAQPPYVPSNQALELSGASNDAGRVPALARPEELLGRVNSVDDAIIWLGLSPIRENADGVHVAWLGDFNGDRLADSAIGLPAAADGAGRIAVVLGRPGGWPLPPDAEDLSSSGSILFGSPDAHVGDVIGSAGDVNGDGYDDLLVGDRQNRRAFVVFGRPSALRRDLTLDGPHGGAWTEIVGPAGAGFGLSVAAAGDVNGDGFSDLLFGATGASDTVYVLLGAVDPWLERIDVSAQAALEIQDAGDAHVAGVGDVDNDELDDFVVIHGSTLYLFNGRDTYRQGEGSPARTRALADAEATFVSADNPPEVVPAGDINGDTYEDFLFSSGNAPKLVLGGPNMSGLTTHTFDNFSPAPSGLVAGLGDVDSNGFADVLLGNSAGDAYLVLGDDLDNVHATLTGVADAATAPFAAGADLNSDGSSDVLLVPLPGASENGGLLSAPDYGDMPHVTADMLPVGTQAAEPGTDRLASWLQPNDDIEHGLLSPLQPTMRYVNDDAGCEGESPCYATIQAAVNAASAGNEIEVQPGAYPPFSVSGKDDLTIRGVHADAVFVDGAGGDYAVHIDDANGTVLEHMTIRNASVAVKLTHAGVGGFDNAALRNTIDRVLTYDTDDHAVDMDRSSTLDVTRSTFVGGDQHIRVSGPADPDLVPGWDDSALVTDNPNAATEDWGGLFAQGSWLNIFHGAHTVDSHRYDVDYGSWQSPPWTDGTYHLATAVDENDVLFDLRGSSFGDFDGTVYEILYVSDSEIYVGGDFRHAGGHAIDYIARWNGTRWAEMGSANQPDEAVRVIKKFGTSIFAGGDFGVSRFHNGSWSAYGDTQGTGAVLAVAFDDNYGTYAGGTFTKMSGLSASRIAHRDNLGTWKQLGGGGSCGPTDSNNGISPAGGNSVQDMEIDGGRVYFSGRFGSAGGGCGTVVTVKSVASVVMSSGQFGSFGASGGSLFYEDTVYDFDFLADGSRIVAGDFGCVDYDYTDPKHCNRTADNLAILESDGSWTVPSFLKAAGTVYDVQVDGYVLLVGGAISQVGGSTSVDNVARYNQYPDDGGSWQEIGSGLPSTALAAVRTTGGDYLVGGSFTEIDGYAAHRLATWDAWTSKWTGQRMYRHDNATLYKTPPELVRPNAAMVADGSGGMYALIGGNSRHFYYFNIASNSWTDKAGLPADIGAGASLAIADDFVYALRGGGTADLCRYRITSNAWTCGLTDAPYAVGAGAALVWDGSDWLYTLVGGNGPSFVRYHIPTDLWQTLPSTPAAMGAVSGGGGLARIGRVLYAVPGGDDDLWRFGPVGVDANKMTLDAVTFVVPDAIVNSTWLHVDGIDPYVLQRQPDDFALSATDSVWVGGDSAVWTPAPTDDPPITGGQVISHGDANFLDPDRHVYRLTVDSVHAAGYTDFVADVTHETGSVVFASIQAAIDSGTNRVNLKPGIYEESFHLISGVEVVGSGADQTIIQPHTSTTEPQLVSAEGVVGSSLAYVTLNGGDTGIDGLYTEGGARYVKSLRNIVRGTDAAIHSSGETTEIEVVNNTIVGNGHGVLADECAPVDTRNTVFADQSTAGLAYDGGCAPRQLHTYNLYWNNVADLDPVEPGGGELFLDPLFLDAAAHDYRTLDVSPVVDAGDPLDPTAPGTGQRTDIGYVEQGRAAYYVDDDYCATCGNNGLIWQADAFNTFLDAFDKVESDMAEVCTGTTCDVRTVGIAPGTYAESVSIPAYVRVVGTDPAEVIVDADGLDVGVTMSAITNAELQGVAVTGAEQAGIEVTDASHDVVIRRCIVRDAPGYGIVVSDRATADIEFNTLIYNRSGGIMVEDAATWATVRNNLFYDNNEYGDSGTCLNLGYNLMSRDSGQLFGDYNGVGVNSCHSQNYSLEGVVEPAGLHDKYTYAAFKDLGDRDLRLRADANAIDAADPLADVPAGGGDRADIGYHEYREPLAAQATVLLGREDVSSATGNSGVQEVEVGVVEVSDPSQPVDETVPTTWTTVTLDDPGSAVARWQTMHTPTAGGLHRFYSRATDVVGNQEVIEADWYEGSFVVDETDPVVTLLAPSSGSTLTSPMELRAQVSDYENGAFTIDEVSFVVDGSTVEASWAAEPWDPTSGDPRVFRAWIAPAVGSHSWRALATDLAGNEYDEATVISSFTVVPGGVADSTSPLLTLVPPGGGLPVTGDTTFSGTITDIAGSGPASVEVSVDGGVTWTPATVSGSSWSLDWFAPADTDHVTYEVRVRGHDRAGNEATTSSDMVLDNIAPHRLAPVTFGFPEGTHFEIPTLLDVTWHKPMDGSGTANVWLVVDQIEDTIPELGNSLPVGTLTTWPAALNADGDWYVHMAVSDLSGNKYTRHYGPWHVGFLQFAGGQVFDRLQTLELDGYLDVENAEWLEDEMIDDDEVPQHRGPRYETQQLYMTWETSGVYLGWQGAWWDVDGEMWVFLSTEAGGQKQPTVLGPPYYRLPFYANMAINIDSTEDGTLYTWDGAAWQSTAATFAHGDSGGTEVKVPIDVFDLADPSGNLVFEMAAFALDDNGDRWSVFPTSCRSHNNRHVIWKSFGWESLAELLNPWENQPVGASVYMDLYHPEEIMEKGPNMDADYSILLTNFEGYAIPGLQMVITATEGLVLESFGGALCDGDCSPGTGPWRLNLGDLMTDDGTPVELGTTTADQSEMGGIETVGLDVGLEWFGIPLATSSIGYDVDSQGPEITLDLADGDSVSPGALDLTGTSADGEGGGVDLVEMSTDHGATWQALEGAIAWETQIEVPTDVAEMDLWVRATDVFGSETILKISLGVDNGVPEASAGGPYAGDEGAAIDIADASAVDPEGVDLDLDWTVDAAACSFDDASALAPTLTCSDNGDFTVTLTVDDGVNPPVAVEGSVAVANVAPTASFGNDGPAEEGGSFTLSFTGGDDASSDDVTAGFEYAFDCDDGSGFAVFGAETSAVCAAADDGQRDAKGHVRDKDLSVTEYTSTVVVNNVTPSATAPSDQQAIEDIETLFDLGSFVDPGADSPWSVEVEWGDGLPPGGFDATTAGDLGDLAHTYVAPSTYTATVTITEDGGTGASVQIQFDVVVDGDSDGDGLTDSDETGVHGTDPLNPDTDDDGLSDGAEVNTYDTDPLVDDSDDDGQIDGDEVACGSDPNDDSDLSDDFDEDGIPDCVDPDDDNDGQSDADEVSCESDPNDELDMSTDTEGDGIPDCVDDDDDNDGLTDDDETDRGTDPLDDDSDDDGLLDGDEVTSYLTDPLDDDSDDDGLIDGDEVNTHDTDPNVDGDADADGLSDADEVLVYDTEPHVVDTDVDGLGDGEEVNTYGTYPLIADSDGDGLTDGAEVNTHLTLPLNSDTDLDGLADGDEVSLYLTDPLVDDDADGDGLSDANEILFQGTNAHVADTDEDGLSDGAEVNTHLTDPLDDDSDDDGLTDGFEVDDVDGSDTDPLDSDSDGDGLNDGDEWSLYCTDANDDDSDGDDLDDGAELSGGTDPCDDDSDDDGLTDGDEVNTHGTDPNDEDTDGDGLSDGYEVDNGLDPLTGVVDADDDGLTNSDELNVYDTDPLDADSDDDDLLDGAEVMTHLTDPNDADSDDDGLFDGEEIALDFDPNNARPGLTADASSVTVDEGQTATLEGSVSDTEGDQVTVDATAGTIAVEDGAWSWSFDTVDGPADGQTVTVTASDAGGLRELTFSLVVDNVTPLVDAGADQTLYENDTVSLDPATFTDPGVLDTHTATIDWGDLTVADGVVDQAAGTVSGEHLYTEPGTYIVTVTVQDSDGAAYNDSISVSVVHGQFDVCISANQAGGGEDEDEDDDGDDDDGILCVDIDGPLPEGLMMPLCSGGGGGYDHDRAHPVQIGARANVGCSVRAEGKVQVMNDATVFGNVVARMRKAQLEDDASVTGSVTSGGRVILENSASVGKHVTSGSYVRLDDLSVVGGNVTAARTVVMRDGATVTGDVYEYADVPPIPGVTTVTVNVSASGGTERVWRRQTKDLEPGSYGRLRVFDGGTLNLSAGTYTFKSMSFGRNTTLHADLDGGDLVVNVERGVSFMKNADVTTSGGGASDVLFRVAGSTISLGRNGTYVGTFVAPRGRIELQRYAELTGALHGRKVQIRADTTITSDPAHDLIEDLFVQ